MVNATHISFTASDRSYYAILKKEIHYRAIEAGFSAARTAELDIVVAEITSNLHKYAVDGEILMGLVGEGEDQYIELISIDSGPGMNDAGRMITDGYSTTNSMGHGLGSIKRLSDKFEIYSLKGWGTIVLSRIFKNPPSRLSLAPKMDIRGIVVAKPGEQLSGDGFYYELDNNTARIFIADGLGHGADANHAVAEGIKAFRACLFDSPVDILRYLHQAVRKTRGMVGAVILFDFDKKAWKLAGIGNLSAKLVSVAGSKNHISYNGIIGHNIPNTMNDQQLSAGDYQMAIFCSDGIKSRWDTSRYTGINKYDLTILAAALYKDFARRTDDMSVIICKLLK